MSGSRSLSFAPRFAFRELRGGLRGFGVFIACIALGVFAIAGVGSVAESLGEGLTRQGRVLLGGDASFSLMQREAAPDEIRFLQSRGQVTIAATMRGMVRKSDGNLGLVEMKAVDAGYPQLGALDITPQMTSGQLLGERDGAFGAAADATLLARLDLKLGDRVSVGNANIEIRSVVNAEPDKLVGGIGFGPRLLLSEAALRATGLLQPGSLVRWTYRVILPPGGNVDALIADARRDVPQAGWEVRSPSNASPQLERSISRFTQFLTLVGLAALLVGGVGVANAVKSHIDRRRNVIAAFKALGATGREVFAIYLVQVGALALIGSLIGLFLGAALPFVVVALFGKMLPLPLAPTLQGGSLALSLLYGLLTALAFALWPLGRVHDVPVAALFRDSVESHAKRPRAAYLAGLALTLALLVASVIALSYDKRVAAGFVVASMLVFALLRGIATGLMALARRLPRPRATMARLALSNIHRPDALTPSVVMSLGLGLAVLVTVTQIDGNLQRQFKASLPEHAPSFYFIDIPSAQADAFQAFLKQRAPNATIEEVPMLRGRIVGAKGMKAEALKPAQDSEWVLQSDRGITYTSDIPRGSKIVEGEWWPKDYAGPPLVSFEKKNADGLGLKVGDEITVNVLGRDIKATIASLRSVDWQNLGINFVLVFSPNTFRGAPHTHIATLTDPASDAAGDASLVKAVAQTYPTVTSVRVREALQTVGSVVENLVLGIRGASAITLVSALLVLGGALAAGHRHRVYDAVILKTLGATRGRLIGGYALEYLMIGLATAVFGVLAGSVAAWAIVTRVMNLSFVWQAGSALGVVAAALLVTVGLGLAGTLVALSRKPAGVLRGL